MGDLVGIGDSDGVFAAVGDGLGLGVCGGEDSLGVDASVGLIDAFTVGVGVGVGVGDFVGVSEGVGVGVGDGVGRIQFIGSRARIRIAMCPARASVISPAATNRLAEGSKISAPASGL